MASKVVLGAAAALLMAGFGVYAAQDDMYGEPSVCVVLPTDVYSSRQVHCQTTLQLRFLGFDFHTVAQPTHESLNVVLERLFGEWTIEEVAEAFCEEWAAKPATVTVHVKYGETLQYSCGHKKSLLSDEAPSLSSLNWKYWYSYLKHQYLG